MCNLFEYLVWNQLSLNWINGPNICRVVCFFTGTSKMCPELNIFGTRWIFFPLFLGCFTPETRLLSAKASRRMTKVFSLSIRLTSSGSHTWNNTVRESGNTWVRSNLAQILNMLCIKIKLYQPQDTHKQSFQSHYLIMSFRVVQNKSINRERILAKIQSNYFD